LEYRDVQVFRRPGKAECLTPGVPLVPVDPQLDPGTDSPSNPAQPIQIGFRVSADFHLQRTEPGLGPPLGSLDRASSLHDSSRHVRDRSIARRAQLAMQWDARLLRGE